MIKSQPNAYIIHVNDPLIKNEIRSLNIYIELIIESKIRIVP